MSRALGAAILSAAFLATAACPPPVAGSPSAAAALARADRKFEALRESTRRQRHRDQYPPVHEAYRAVFEGHRGSREAETALLRAGELQALLFRWSGLEADLARALELFRRLLVDYPASPLAAQARRAVEELYRKSPGGSGAAAALLARADERFARLKASPRKQRYRDQYDPVLEAYRAVFDGHRGSREAETALLRAGELHTLMFRWTRRGADLNRAQHYYQSLVEDYPGSPLADDALYAIGELYLEHFKEPAQAYLRFAEIERLAPGSDRVADARRMLRKLASHAPTAPAASPAPPPRAPAPERSEPAATAPGGQPRVPEPMSLMPTVLTRIKRVRHWSNPEYTRVVIDLDQKSHFYSNLLQDDAAAGKPPRLYVDLFNALLDDEFSKPIPVNDGILLSIRAGQFTPDTVRVVLDIDRLRSYRIFPMESPFRVVIDVSGGGAGEPRVASGAAGVPEIAPLPPEVAGSAPAPPAKPSSPPVPTAPPPRAPPPVNGKLTIARQLGLGVGRVVIDPGHGAHDPGAVGFGGVKEKDVVLDVGLRLRDLLQAAGLEVVMTRDRDVYLPLEERTAIANTSHGDLFVSLHCNSSDKGDLSGVETYFLNLASSRRAMATAARENSMAVARMSDLQNLLKEIFTSKMDESSRLAERIQGSLHGKLRQRWGDVRDLGVKQAPFYVLIGAEMPSILAEISFINHKVEGRRLADPDYRQAIAAALAEGVREYVREVKFAGAPNGSAAP